MHCTVDYRNLSYFFLIVCLFVFSQIQHEIRSSRLLLHNSGKAPSEPVQNDQVFWTADYGKQRSLFFTAEIVAVSVISGRQNTEVLEKHKKNSLLQRFF